MEVPCFVMLNKSTQVLKLGLGTNKSPVRIVDVALLSWSESSLFVFQAAVDTQSTQTTESCVAIAGVRYW